MSLMTLLTTVYNAEYIDEYGGVVETKTHDNIIVMALRRCE
jgi:hypothetical protein